MAKLLVVNVVILMKTYFIILVMAFFSVGNCHAQYPNYITKKIFVKPVEFVYQKDSVIPFKMYIESSGFYYFRFPNEEVKAMVTLFFEGKTTKYLKDSLIFLSSSEVVHNYFPKTLTNRWDCNNCDDLSYSYPLYLFSEKPVENTPEEDVIRISYVNFQVGSDSYNQASTYHLIKIIFTGDSTVMQYKEGKFEEGDFNCYVNTQIKLSKKEADRIKKLDQKIEWESQDTDCYDEFSSGYGVIERKKDGLAFSCLRSSRCQNIDKKSLSSMNGLLIQITFTRSKKIKTNVNKEFFLGF